MKSIKRYRNTSVQEFDNPHTGKYIVVRLHGHSIFFKMLSTNNVWISAGGGLPTMTTIKRLNECFKEYDINLYAHREDGVAYIDANHGTYPIAQHGMWIEDVG